MHIRLVGAAVVAGLAIAVGIHALTPTGIAVSQQRTTPLYDPPVLAGQQLWGACSGGVYARLGTTVVLTSTGHCTSPGTVAYDPDGVTVRGTFGPAARDATCPYPGHICASSDINYLVVAPDRIPWGHLNVIDMGMAGYRVIPPGTTALGCADIAIGDGVEIDGRNTYRSGTVVEKGRNLNDADGSYFPCMIASHIKVDTGDSGGVVLVRGIPAGVVSRSFGGSLGFTPLAEGLAQLGLELCSTPDCDLVRQVAAPVDAIAWSLQGVGGGGVIGKSPGVAAIADTATSVDVFVASWPLHEPPGESWVTPSVSYSSDSVTITLHPSAAYEAVPRDPRIGMYDTGGWISVPLSEPLHGRALLDGSSSPAEARPYR